MKAVILAAGKGKRLHPITLDIPKAMVPVCGKPMLEILLRQLKTIGLNEVVLVVHYKKEHIMDYFGKEFEGIKIEYAEQKEMKGTADAILTAEPHVKEDHFIAIAADTLAPTELFKKLTAHNTDMVLTVCKVNDAKRFGVIETNGKKVIRIVEKSQNPPTNLANTSVYYFPREVFEACKEIGPSPRGEYEITDAIQLLIDKGTNCEFEIIENWLDIGTEEHLKHAQKLAEELGLRC